MTTTRRVSAGQPDTQMQGVGVTGQPYPLVVWTAVLILASASAVESTLVILGAVFGTPVILMLSFLWPRKWQFRKWRLLKRYAVPISLALIVSVFTTHWPLKAHYHLVKGRLNRIADRVEAKEPVSLPCQVGLFRIKKAEVYGNGITCLWTGDNPAGHAGFVRTSPDKVRFNLWAMVQLDNDWQFIKED